MRLLTAATLLLLAASATAGDGKPVLEEAQILITVHEPVGKARRLSGAPGRAYRKRRSYQATPETNRTLDELAMDYSLQRVEGWHITSLGVYCEVYSVAGDRAVEEVLTALAADPRVESAQPMQTFHVMTDTYDDPYFSLQSAAHSLAIQDAHRWARGKGVTVAVVDTGVDANHPDLSDRVVYWKNFAATRGDSGRHEIHGTAVAGVIVSAANNKTGIVGVAPEARVMALRACWPDTERSISAKCSSLTLAKAMEFALSKKADVLNLSLTGPPDPLLARIVRKALERDIVVVSSAAPEHTEQPGFPEEVDGVIAVRSNGASAPARHREASHRFAAPGTDIMTTAPFGGYELLSGSSFAAAHVSGIVALLLELDPSLSLADVVAALRASHEVGEPAESVNACKALAHLGDAYECGSRSAAAR